MEPIDCKEPTRPDQDASMATVIQAYRFALDPTPRQRLEQRFRAVKSQFVV
jgi:hypothetical protein